MKNKFKKNICISIVLIFMFNNFIVGEVVKAEKNKDNKLYVNARTAIALDSKSKMVLYEKSSDMIIPMASTTKIVTALVALKYGNLDKKVKISANAAAIRGSTVGFKKGEEITIKELLCGLMLRSGNDAAIAIAEGISGSVEEFLKLMNEYADEIGLLDSQFESPHGLDSQNHYTTAYDLALATAKAKEIKFFNQIVAAKDINAKDYNFTRSYHNINKILYHIPAATGVKTGYTGQAGKCLVTSVKIEGHEVIIVTLNCTERWKETKKIYDYICKNYHYEKLIDKDKVLGSIGIKDCKNKVDLICNKDIILPVKNGDKYDVSIKKPLYDVAAPINKGDDLGNVCIMKDGKVLEIEALQAKNSIEKCKKSIFQRLNIFKK